MTHQEIMQLLLRVEEKLPVTQWEFQKIRIWPLIRISIAFQLYSQNILREDKKSSPEIKLDRKRGLSKLIDWENRSIKHKIEDKKNRKRINAADICFFTYDSNRTLFDGKWHNRNIDPLVNEIKHLKKKAIVLELPEIGLGNVKKYNEKTCLNLKSYVERNFKPVIEGEISLFLEKFDEFFELISPFISQDRINQFNFQGIQKMIAKVLGYKKIFKDLLQDSRIKIAFVTCYYEVRSMAFILACNERGIKTIDIPHGTHGELHAAYGSWTHLSGKGYDFLPEIFWSWSKDEFDTISKWAKNSGGKHSAVIGGNPWIEFWKNDNHKMTQRMKIRAEKMRKSSGKKTHVLFSLQPYALIQQAIPEYICKAIIDSSEDMYWWIRLHPRQPQSMIDIEKFLIENGIPSDCINLNEANELPLPVILSSIDVHITDFSSVVIEAHEMGKPSVVYSENGGEVFKNLLLQGHVVQSNPDTKDILSAINRQQNVTINQSRFSKSSVLRELLIKFA